MTSQKVRPNWPILSPPTPSPQQIVGHNFSAVTTLQTGRQRGISRTFGTVAECLDFRTTIPLTEQIHLR